MENGCRPSPRPRWTDVGQERVFHRQDGRDDVSEPTKDDLVEKMARVLYAADREHWASFGHVPAETIPWEKAADQSHGLWYRYAKAVVESIRTAAPAGAEPVEVALLREARQVIRRLPRFEEAGKYCANCGEKSGWDSIEKAERTLDPKGQCHTDWCVVPTAYLMMARIDAVLAGKGGN